MHHHHHHHHHYHHLQFYLPQRKHNTIGKISVYKQSFCYSNAPTSLTKDTFVSTANKALVGTLITIGDVNDIFPIHLIYGEDTSRNHWAYVKRSPRNNNNKYKNSAAHVRHEQIGIIMQSDWFRQRAEFFDLVPESGRICCVNCAKTWAFFSFGKIHMLYNGLGRSIGKKLCPTS